MPDYSLGRAHGKIEITYDGGGARAAAKDLDNVTTSSTAADKSLTKTQKTLKNTDREFDSAGDAAQGYNARLKDVRQSSQDVDAAQRRLNSTLMDSKSTVEDIEDAYRHLEDAQKRHVKTVDAERDAHRALTDRMSAGQRVMSGLSSILPNLSRNIERLSIVQDDATDKASGLAQALGIAAKAVGFLGPQGRAASAGLMLASEGIEKVSGSAQSAGGVIGDFVKDIAGLELAVAKVGGLALGLPSLGGLAGLGGAAGVQGVINIVGAVRQLSGALGLLPAVVAGVGFSMKTLEVAFHGVGDALSDMMADDPKKFLEDIKDMGPVAAEAMLGIAAFRDEFKLAGAAVQDSFFTKIADDIKPLLQTWLPLVSGGMAHIAGIFGDAAHELASLFETPEAVQAFSAFIQNIAAGLQAMQPAIKPLFGIFEQLIVIGSSFFEQIGGAISNTLTVLVGLLGQATTDGRFQAWIQSAIDGFGHLVDMIINVSQAFGTIMTIAEKFGGGGLLGWLDQMAIALNNWTQSDEGQKALTDFFTTVREATDAFMPMLGPLVSGLASIGTAFVKLGVATAPGWQVVFDTFAQTMAQLGPQIVGIAPALNSFLTGMADAFSKLMAQLGPKLPQIFESLANAFLALLPQIGPLVNAFLDLVEQVGPMLPSLFSSVTEALETLVRYWPIVVGVIRDVVSVVSAAIRGVSTVVHGFEKLVEGVADGLSSAWQAVENWLGQLPSKAKGWGKSILDGLIEGLKNATGLGALTDAAKGIVDGIAGWFQSSPAKWGPFSGDGYTKIRGQKMVADMAAGMASAQGSVAAAARMTAETAAGALGGGTPAAGGAESLGGALLPSHIAGADNSVLSAYLRHQFSDTRGLKGLANDMGNILAVAQSGLELVTQNIAGTMFQALGLIPSMNTRPWVKLSPEQIAAQRQNEAERKALEGQKKQGPTWADVFGADIKGAGTPATPKGATVPLVQNPDGTWTSPNAAWAHLINRESSGINQRQGIVDVNSGGNEAEGLFQITPATWKAHGGTDFAPNALAATPQQQAAIAARILQGNPSGSDWGAGLPGRESAKELLAGLTEASPAAEPKNKPTWNQVTQGTYGLRAGTDTGGYGTGNAKTFPEWVMALADQFGVKPSTYAGHQESDRHEEGYAPNPNHENRGIDWAAPMTKEGIASMQRLADYLATIPGAMEQVIWENPNTGQRVGVVGGRVNPGYYPDGTYAKHQNHVHTRQSAPIPLPDGSVLVPAQPTGSVGGSAGAGNGLVLPSGQSLDDLLDTSSQNLTVNDQLLQAYLKGNPALAAQIDAAKTPGASDESVLTALTGIDSTITDLKTQDAVGNKNTIGALQAAQGQISKDAGFQQGQSALSTAQSFVSGAANAVSSVFQVFSSTLDALGATQDIADRLVYGVRNTEDVMKIVDNVQKYITLASNIANATGSILSTIGGLAGAGSSGDPSGGAAGASMALSSAGQIAQLIGAALEGVNMAINFGQQLYHIAGTYVGRFLSQLTAGLGGTPLMGDVRFLLNKNTGQLITYSEDNPGNKNSLNVPTWLNQTYDYGGGQNPNPQVNTQWNIYAGPGQSPGEMLNETMWMVNTAGTTGAMSPANF